MTIMRVITLPQRIFFGFVFTALVYGLSVIFAYLLDTSAGYFVLPSMFVLTLGFDFVLDCDDEIGQPVDSTID